MITFFGYHVVVARPPGCRLLGYRKRAEPGRPTIRAVHIARTQIGWWRCPSRQCAFDRERAS